MSKQVKARSMNRKTEARTGGRDVLLAGIGAASLLRRNAGKAFVDAAAAIGQLPEKSAELVEAFGERANAFKVEFVWRVGPSFGRKVKALASDGVATVESRLRPLLGKLGIKSPATKAGKRRKAATGKASAKRAVAGLRKAG